MQSFKERYKSQVGDCLKNKILNDFKGRIECTSTIKELNDLKEELVKSPEYHTLKTAQGWFTQATGINTSSVDAFEEMFKDQRANINNQTKTEAITSSEEKYHQNNY